MLKMSQDGNSRRVACYDAFAIGSTSRASFEENKEEAKREEQWVFENDYKVKKTTKS